MLVIVSAVLIGSVAQNFQADSMNLTCYTSFQNLFLSNSLKNNTFAFNALK